MTQEQDTKTPFAVVTVTDRLTSTQWFIVREGERVLHREDGPSTQIDLHHDCRPVREWRQDGKLHRRDGPAIEDVIGDGWFFDGKPVPPQLMRRAGFITYAPEIADIAKEHGGDIINKMLAFMKVKEFGATTLAKFFANKADNVVLAKLMMSAGC